MSKSNETTPNVPTLRFSQYHSDWTRCSLSDIANVVGGGTPDTVDETLWNGDVQWFTPTEVGRSKYVSKSIRTISQSGLKKSSAKILPKGSVLLSSRATVGECSIAQIDCTTNQGFQSLIPKSNVNNEFLYYLAQTKKRHFIKYASGSTFLEISNSEIKKTKCFVPRIEEQTKIAEFLSLIDRKLGVQNKIIEDLKVLKKELCNKVFNSSCCDSEIKVRGIARVYGGYAFSSKTYVDNGQYKIITIGNVTGEHFISGEYNTVDCLPQNIQEQQILDNGDILISLTGNVGRISLVKGNNFLLNQRVAKLVIEDKALKDYVYQYLSHSSFEKDMQNAGQGAAQKNIKNEDILSYNIRIPSEKATLDNIVNLFLTCDKKIENEMNIINHLQRQKSFLLDAMFI